LRRSTKNSGTVEGCLRQHNYKFEREASRVPEFFVDLLKAVRGAIKNTVGGHRSKNSANGLIPLSQLTDLFNPLLRQ